MAQEIRYCVVKVERDRDDFIYTLNIGSQAGADPFPIKLITSSPLLKTAIGTVAIGAEINIIVVSSPYTEKELEEISKLTPM